MPPKKHGAAAAAKSAPSEDAAPATAKSTKYREHNAVITSSGVLNTDTISSASTCPVGPQPSSAERGAVPGVANVKIRPAVPELPEHIRALLDASKKKEREKSGHHGAAAAGEDDDAAAVAGAGAASSAPSAGTNEDDATATSAASRAADASVCTVSFDLAPVAAPVANLLRRLILTEVPTMAFDRVLIDENDTPVYDEMLCHRLGMVPVQCDADKFEYVTSENVTPAAGKDATAAAAGAAGAAGGGLLNRAAGGAGGAAGGAGGGGSLYTSAKHVLHFDLDESVPLDAPLHTVRCVYARDLKWRPLPGQDHLNARVVHPDLLLAKLGCGQRIKLQAFALKGIGLTHAKWAPVSACYYEMQTVVKLLKPVRGAMARQLVALAPKVFRLVGDGANADSADNGNGNDNDAAVHAEVLREIGFQDCSRLFQDGVDFSEHVSIEKEKSAVRFYYESLGQFADPTALVGVALRSFAQRVRYLKRLVEKTKISNAGKFEEAAQSAQD